MRKNAVGGAGINQKTPLGELVCDVNQLAGGNGVDKTPDTSFPCQPQGDTQLRALSPGPVEETEVAPHPCQVGGAPGRLLTPVGAVAAASGSSNGGDDG